MTATEWGAFTVVGIYRVPATPGDYWAGALGDLFPTEFASQLASKSEAAARRDVHRPQHARTGRAAIRKASCSVAQLVDRAVLSPADLSRLAATGAVLSSSDALSASQATVNTQLDATVAGVRASWRTLRIAVLLVTVQTLLLVWLLLFLSVTDAVEARGRDCALAKLRGYPRWRLLVVALSESVTLLALAWPIGVGLAWAASCGAERAAPAATAPRWSCRPRRGVVAGAGIIGGLVAVGIAGRRVLRRPIVDQWRPTAGARVHRSWVFDAVVLTIACAGLAELIGGAKVTSSAKPASLVLVVPGLLGVAIAVVASRALGGRVPSRVRADIAPRPARLFPRGAPRRPPTGRHADDDDADDGVRAGGLRARLVVDRSREPRARGGGGERRAGGDDRRLRAGHDLGAIVDQIDPAGTAGDGGRRAPRAVGRIRADRRRLASARRHRGLAAVVRRTAPLAAIAADLRPNAAAPIVLAGGTLRVRGSVADVSEPLRLTADVTGTDGRPQHLDLGTLDGAGPFTSATADMTGCPCTLTRLRDRHRGQPRAREARAGDGAI